MKKAILFVFIIVISLSSCQTPKDFIKSVSKKEEIKTPNTKKVLVFSSDDVRINEFKKTFEKNYPAIEDFTISYLNDFTLQLKDRFLYETVHVDRVHTSYDDLDKTDIDYVLYFSNFEIANRVEFVSSGGMGMNGMAVGMQTTSVEYCVINVRVEIYDTKNNKEIIDFIAIGEASVFLFNFTKTFQKAKQKSIEHILNYLQSGKTTYKNGY